MSNKYTISISVLLISMLIMNFYCRKDVPVIPVQNTFLVPVDIYPLKKTYSLTDTIWLTTALPDKYIFDTKINKKILVDTGQITFGAGYNEFGTYITSPSNGFCDVITPGGVNANRQLSQWGTSGIIENYGCGKPTYTCSIGFKPNEKGTYWIILNEDIPLSNCNNKVIPSYAIISYKYSSTDLNLDVFNALSKNDRGGNEGAKFYTDKINNGQIFVFKVE